MEEVEINASPVSDGGR